MRKLLIAAFAATTITGTAFAQSGHGHADKGPHGGSMQDVAGVHAELLLAERVVTIHLYDEAGKPVPSAGYTASTLIGTGQSREVVQLTPRGDNALAGEARTPPARGAAVTLQIKNPGGRSGQARF
jgi:hypothetical protein